jgi:hypothetical protein
MLNMNKVIYSVILVLSLLVPGSVAQVQGQKNPSVFVTGSSITHGLDLKAFEGETPTSKTGR